MAIQTYIVKAFAVMSDEPVLFSPRTRFRAAMVLVHGSQLRALLTSVFWGDGDPFPLAIDVDDRKCPERNQINAGHEFSSECRQKFPVPAEQVNQHGRDHKIKYVISG